MAPILAVLGLFEYTRLCVFRCQVYAVTYSCHYHYTLLCGLNNGDHTSPWVLYIETVSSHAERTIIYMH